MIRGAFYKISNSKCCFHTTPAVWNRVTVLKQGTLLKKIMFPKSKRKWYENNPNAMPVAKGLSKTQKEPSKRALKRVAVLNKMFMKYITDLMSTGSISMEVLGKGLEISKVKVAQDFQTVNVFWVTKGKELEAEMELTLNKIAGILRHELSQLRVMGEVPTIVFVKDTEQAQLVELDRRLSIADYGEDFVPSKLGNQLISDFTLESSLSENLKEKIRNLEQSLDVCDGDVPPMTHCVYGLDHEKITRRILAARKKNIDAWCAISEASNVTTFRRENNSNTISNDYGEDNQNLKDYLQKRKIEEEKLRRELLSKKAELRLALEEKESSNEQEDYYYDSDFDESEIQDVEGEKQ